MPDQDPNNSEQLELPETSPQGESSSPESAPENPPFIQKEVKEDSPLHVKLQIYDGPLDLLLDLIKENEMDICDIQITEITQQYIAYLEQMKSLDLEVAGEFIVMAATLIHIKSRMLLPTVEDEEDEEEGVDPRAELVQKLMEYQAFKEAAKELGLMQTERGKTFTRQITDYYLADLNSEDAEIDTFSANFYDLIVAFQNVLSKHGKEKIHEIYEEIISIEDKTEQLKKMIQVKRKVLFFDLFSEKWTKNELVVTFLSLLEMVRMKFVIIKQEDKHSDIMIEMKEEELTFVNEDGE